MLTADFQEFGILGGYLAIAEMIVTFMVITALESSSVGNHKYWFKLWAASTSINDVVKEPTTCKMDDCVKLF